MQKNTVRHTRLKRGRRRNQILGTMYISGKNIPEGTARRPRCHSNSPVHPPAHRPHHKCVSRYKKSDNSTPPTLSGPVRREQRLYIYWQAKVAFPTGMSVRFPHTDITTKTTYMGSVSPLSHDMPRYSLAIYTVHIYAHTEGKINTATLALLHQHHNNNTYQYY